MCLSEDCNLINFNDLNSAPFDNENNVDANINETDEITNNNVSTNNEINENQNKQLLVNMCENCFEVFDNKVRRIKNSFLLVYFN